MQFQHILMSKLNMITSTSCKMMHRAEQDSGLLPKQTGTVGDSDDDSDDDSPDVAAVAGVSAQSQQTGPTESTDPPTH